MGKAKHTPVQSLKSTKSVKRRQTEKTKPQKKKKENVTLELVHPKARLAVGVDEVGLGCILGPVTVRYFNFLF
jgi:ribonuclease HIII